MISWVGMLKWEVGTGVGGWMDGSRVGNDMILNRRVGSGNDVLACVCMLFFCLIGRLDLDW